jgi:hypothetical protein
MPGQQPTMAGQQPVMPVQQPVMPGQKPVMAGQQPMPAQQPTMSVQQPTMPVQQPNIANNNANALQEKANIYVDLSCFLNNMKKLEDHSDNSLVEMALLTSNLKSCSYVKKNKSVTENSGTFVDKVVKSLEVPKQDSVNLVSIPKTVIVTGAKETFENVENSIYWTDIIKVVILLLLIYVLINKK